MSYSLFIVDCDDYCIETFLLKLKKFEEIKPAGQCSDGTAAVEEVTASRPDIILIDISLPGMDGVGVVECIRKIPNYDPVIVITAISGSDLWVWMSLECGADYYVVKPFDSDSLIRRILNMCRCKDGAVLAYYSKVVSEMLCAMGFPVHLNGFEYTREAVILLLDRNRRNRSLTGHIYKTIADRHATTVSKVESAIRGGIEATWLKGDLSHLHRLFGSTVDPDRAKPTNAQFLKLLAESIRQKYPPLT